MIEFRDVSKTYENGTHALNHVNIKINKGEFVFVVGASGAGKSTFLKLMMREEVPSHGKVIIKNQDLSTLTRSEIPYFRRGLGIVFQDFRLIPKMTVFDNVAFAMRVTGSKENKIQKRVPFVLDIVGLTDKMNCYPTELSGGEQQRVALARVLVLRPQLILMDEPLSNLDAKLRLHMRTEIRRIQQELKLTCLYVTHDQKEALTMSDRIMVMNKGKIEQIGTPMHLYDDPATPFVADFIGQANLLYGTLVSVEDKYGIVDVAGRKVKARMGVLNPPKVGGKALLIVRPENLNIGASDNCLAVKLINRLFEGDRVDYQFEVVNGFNPKPYSMSVPFLPGTTLLPEGSTLDASFVPNAGVLLNGE